MGLWKSSLDKDKIGPSGPIFTSNISHNLIDYEFKCISIYMKNTIIEIINSTNPKSVSKKIKNNAVLSEWVCENSSQSSNFSQRIYDSVHCITSTTCDNGNFKKFKSITTGYGFCAVSSQCKCARQHVSESVALSKKSYSAKTKQEINTKRATTNLKKYGVYNVGQTADARQKHQDFYAATKKQLVKKSTLIEQSYFKIKQRVNKTDVELLTPVHEYMGVSNQAYYQFQCKLCDFLFSTYLDNGNVPICKKCNPTIPSYVSQAETTLKEYVQDLRPDLVVEQSNKTIINPFELDIVIPELKIAIEYCGLYWHSSLYKKSIKYHYDKMIKTNQQGYRLITIFEDEWVNKQHIVKSRLENILGKSEKLYARKLSVKLVTGSQAREFLNNTHIQGYCSASINIALCDDTGIVALMSFGKPRYNKTYEYEIIRYASLGTVVGGASKLFRHFIRMYAPSSVISYCDMRWGTGELYSAIGMTFLKSTQQGYCYTNFTTRLHRSNFTKSKLLENPDAVGNTEEELAASIKWYRIGDCGNNLYVWHCE